MIAEREGFWLLHRGNSQKLARKPPSVVKLVKDSMYLAVGEGTSISLSSLRKQELFRAHL